MNWFNILFQIDIFRKIIFTTLACFVISIPNENNWHMFPKCLFYKNYLTNWTLMWLIFWMNRFKMFLEFYFFWMSMIIKELPCNFFLDELVWHTLSNWLFLKCHSHNSSMFCDITSSWKWLICFSEMSFLEKLNPHNCSKCDLSFEWTDSRCLYNSLL